MATPTVRALCFDIFGTVVDWYGSIAAEVARIGLDTDGGAFALAWRAGYQPAMQQVRSGALPWTNIDGLHRRILDRILAERGLSLPEPQASDFNRVWHRLNFAWVAFFALMGLLNLWVAYHFSTDTWVNFKLFGGLGLMLLFTLAQGLYLSRHLKNDEAPASKAPADSA